MSWFRKDDEPKVVTVISDVSGSEPRPVAESYDRDRAMDKLEEKARNNRGTPYSAEDYIEYTPDWLRNNSRR